MKRGHHPNSHRHPAYVTKGGMPIVAIKKLTPEGVKRRYQWYADYNERLSQLVNAEKEARWRFKH